MHTVTRQFTIRYLLLMQSVKGQTFVAIFYRISAWLDHCGFTGIEIFTYIQVYDVPAKLNNNSFINCVCHQKCKYREMISTEIMGLIANNMKQYFLIMSIHI